MNNNTPEVSERAKRIASLIVLWLLVAGSWKSIEVVGTIVGRLIH